MGRLGRVSSLLFFSGLCALIYQTAWMRMFRLLFGASTLATSATLAVFMAGLGLGGFLLARRVENHKRPLKLYAQLELAISGWAFVSVWVFDAMTAIYHGTGGSQTLGPWGATVLRLVMSVVVMGPAVFLMGATLPAASRAVTLSQDTARKHVAALLGLNTVGAFGGVLLTTFVLLEVLGTRQTLMVAALVNALVGLFAQTLARGPDGNILPLEGTEEPTEAKTEASAPLWFVLLAAAVVGFAFMLMELVWYRMLGPILGGSTYTFGIVLAVALAGLGLGGGLYAFLKTKEKAATLTALAVTCALEAFFLLLPLALGDRIALFAGYLRNMGLLGFSWLVLSWLLVTALVVLPVALVAGYQFPLLIALLGRGREKLGTQVAWTYAANTLGSIVGALAGGFGVIPWLGSVGTWRVLGIVLLLVSLGALLLPLAKRQVFSKIAAAVAFGFVLVSLGLVRAEGPTAAWRHSGIGAGRASFSDFSSVDEIEEWKRTRRRELFWEKDGIESSVALMYSNGIAFLVNGKSDGSSRGDAGTQVMGGLLGAAMHPRPKSALVVGLGTGSTAGWLAQVSQMQEVDVAEIEPAIAEMARRSRAVNHDVLNHPKVRVVYEDAREMLLTSKKTYDIIFSEPSNPYRAGIASLYTREFYEAARSHLKEDGVFLQWLQAYEVDSTTVRSVMMTLRNVFPHVDVWQTLSSDLVLRASMKPPKLSVEALKTRLTEEPFATAMRVAWTTDSVEGFLSHFVADDALVSSFENEADINTDDVNFVEFAFARSVGRRQKFTVGQMAQAARAKNAHRPAWLDGAVDWDKVKRERDTSMEAVKGLVDAYRQTPFEPATFRDRVQLAYELSVLGDDRALEVLKPMTSLNENEAAAVEVRLHLQQRKLEETGRAFIRWLEILRKNPWVSPAVNPEATLVDTVKWLGQDKAWAPVVFKALAEPFASGNFEELRKKGRVFIADQMTAETFCKEAYEAFEPHTPWARQYLEMRVRCYEATDSEWLPLAKSEWAMWLASESEDWTDKNSP